MGETQFRSKIYWLTFCFSLMVVWVHSYNWELFLGQTPEGNAVALVERIFGESLGQMAVPGFFLVSGYLFFRTFALKGNRESEPEESKKSADGDTRIPDCRD